MEFLDKETEELLKKCVESEKTYPSMLREMFSETDEKHNDILRSQINLLIEEGYLSRLSWRDDLPGNGRIEQKGRVYFRNKDLYIRSMLRNNPLFPLDSESEKSLSILLSMGVDETYFVVTKEDLSAVVLNNLIDNRIVKTGPKGIGYDMSGGFAAVIMITQKGRTYFDEKDKYIEEILAFPISVSQTNIQNQLNVKTGDYSPVQVGNKNCEQNIDYDFCEAQKVVDELRDRLTELELSSEKQQEVIDNLDTAQDLIKTKKKGPLKAILKSTYEIIKDVGCSIISGLLLAKMQGM